LALQGASSAALLETTRSTGNSNSSSGGSAAAWDSQSDSSAQQPAAGSRLVGLVPVLDIANHTCRSNCHHAVDYDAGRFNLYISDSSSSSSSIDRISTGSSSSSSVSQQPGVAELCAPASHATPQEVLTTYGEKDNRWAGHVTNMQLLRFMLALSAVQ
jgi:hypothetical protein